MKKFADIHCHPTLFPYSRKRGGGNALESSIWFQDKTKIKNRNTTLPRFSQTDLVSLLKGNVKLVFASLSPIEQNWFSNSNSRKNITQIGQIVTHFSKRRINQIQNNRYNYFDELLYEYYFLLKQIRNKREIFKNGQIKNVQAIIPKNIDEFEKYMNDDDAIIIIPTIEGMHSLISGNNIDLEDISSKEIIESIKTLKQLIFPPLFITFAHHFYNGLSGHEKSLNPQNRLQTFLFKLVDQTYKINEDINEVGKDAVLNLLSIQKYKNCGRRILIDAKHMSITSRRTFYKIITEHNKNNPDDIIPIIHSHTAYSGFDSMETLEQISDLDQQFYNDSYLFNPSTINLADEEVRIIFESGGLIGISLEEKLISGKITLNQAKKKYDKKPTDKMRLYWAKQILRNILGMVNAVIEQEDVENKEKIWDIFAIGSDFDGFIDPVDAFVTSEEFPSLEHFLTLALEKHRNFERINFGFTAEEIIKKIMFQNAFDFIKKHYFQKKNSYLEKVNISITES